MKIILTVIGIMMIFDAVTCSSVLLLFKAALERSHENIRPQVKEELL